MTKERFLQLYKKFQEDQCSPAEVKELFDYEDDMKLEGGDWEGAPGIKWLIKDRIKSRLNKSIRPSTNENTHWYWMKYVGRAAAVLLILIICAEVGNKLYTRHHSISKQGNLPKQVSGVSLVLGNGRTISLSSAGKGIVTNASGVTAKKISDAELTYAHEDVNSSQPAEINTLRTPPGLQYAVTLSDGSRVHLNASSTLQYPVYFTGNQREVILTGEAYFEVKASPDAPFIVHTSNQKIQALGTAFNIKDYNGDVSRTTLISGAVNVVVANTSRLLSAGQQLLYNNLTNSVLLQDINPETVLAWKNGLFAFDREPIADIMMEIGRWYNVEIVFDGGDKSKKFTGVILRYAKIEDVLMRLEKTGAMKFHLENKKIIVQIP